MEHCSPAHDTGNCHSTMDIIVLKTIVEGKYPLKLETRHGANHKKRVIVRDLFFLTGGMSSYVKQLRCMLLARVIYQHKTKGGTIQV